jgi:hypothetical protein
MTAGFSFSPFKTAIRAAAPPLVLDPLTGTSPKRFASIAASSPSLLWLIMTMGSKFLNFVT